MLLQNFRPIRGGLVGKIVLDGPRQISFEFEDGTSRGLSKNTRSRFFPIDTVHRHTLSIYEGLSQNGRCYS